MALLPTPQKGKALPLTVREKDLILKLMRNPERCSFLHVTPIQLHESYIASRLAAKTSSNRILHCLR